MPDEFTTLFPIPDEERMVLARYDGERPPAPSWYRDAVATEPERSRFRVNDREIELLTWGERGKPGLLFLHGMSAHADWWSFIIPFFSRTWRCAAISFSGMGGSDWCDDYTFDRFAEEAVGAIDAGQLCAGGDDVIVIAHSLGGHPAMLSSAADPRIRAVICIDTAIHPRFGQPAKRDSTAGQHRLYPDVRSALSRFRLDPPQTSEHHFLIDHIARRGLRQVEQDGKPAWSWRFDPDLWNILDRSEVTTFPSRVRCPMVYMHGERSKLIDREIMEFMQQCLPAGTPFIAIPDADHHVLADQPLALVGALRSVLACWPGDRTSVQDQGSAAARD